MRYNYRNNTINPSLYTTKIRAKSHKVHKTKNKTENQIVISHFKRPKIVQEKVHSYFWTYMSKKYRLCDFVQILCNYKYLNIN